MSRLSFVGLLALCVGMAAEAAQAQQGAPVPTVVVQPAEQKSLARQAEFIGRIEAVERVDVRARITGVLETPRFKDGEKVAAGQLLYVIEPDQFKVAVDSKKAQLASAKADALNAELTFERTQELVKTNATTRSMLDQRRAELARAEANVQIAEAALKDAEITLGYTEIRAPIAGRVGRTTLTAGNLVSPSSNALTTIVNDESVRAAFSISQREMLEYRRMEKSARPLVRLKLADGSFFSQAGTFDYVDNVVDPQTDGLLLRATFPNPGSELKHDQSVRVVFEQPAEAAQVVMPQNALAADQTGSYVLLVDAEQKVAVRYVKIGQMRDGLAVVTEGLKPGEMVIVQGQQRVRPGMKVNVQTAVAGN